MKNDSKIKLAKFLSILPIVSLFFLLVSSAQAATVLDTQTTITGSCGPIDSYATSYPFSYYTQRINHYANNINKITFNFLGRNPQKSIGFYICEGLAGGTASDSTCTGSGQSVAGYENIVIASSTAAYNWIPSEPILLKSATNYFISVTSATNFALSIYQSGDAATCYTYNISKPMSGWTPSWLNARNKSLYFVNYYDDEFRNPKNLEVQLISPAEGSEYWLASAAFSGLYRDDNRQADSLYVKIYNKDLNQTIIKNFSLASTSVATGTRTFGNSFDDVATFMNYQMPGSAYWTAWLATNTIQISSDTPANNFLIGTTTNPLYNQFSLKAEDLCIDDDLNTIQGQVSCAAKTAAAWCFQPSQSAMDKLGTSWVGLKGAFPFNMFYGLTDSVINTIASTTMNQNDTIGLPMIDGDKNIEIMPVLSSSSMANAIGTENTNTIRSTFIWIAWAMIAFLIFVEIRYI